MVFSRWFQGALAVLALAAIAGCGSGSEGGGTGGASGTGGGSGQGGVMSSAGTGGSGGTDAGGAAGGATAGTGASGTAGTGGGAAGSTTTGTGGAAGSGGATGGATGSGGAAGSSGSGGAAGAGGSAGSGGAAGVAGRGGSGGAGTGGGAGAGGGGRGGASGGGRGGGGGTAGASGASGTGGVSGLPARATVIDLLRRANTYFVNKWPDPGTRIDSSHESHIWTRAVYYEGLMALNGVDPQASYVDYAVRWGTSHSWGLVGGTTTRSADNQCAGQTYIDLYNLDAQATRIRDIKTDIDMVVSGSAVNDWTWIDAIQMAMPVYAKLGKMSSGATATGYYDKAYAQYANTKNVQGGNGLYSKTDHLWWRDQDFDPPYTEPNGKSCYWSRGNGWVFAALARVLDTIPANEAHRAEYLADFQAMAEALRAVQRSDGFWNVSLLDPTHYGGPELTGTSLFIYGMAWGVRTGVLSSATYTPVITRGWTAMASTVHTNGFLGYVQGTGKQPSDGQPVTLDSVPNFEDFGLGCFLLGGSEVARLAVP